MLSSIKYYLWASYRRKNLDKLLAQNQSYYNGTVLDIGGRDRGKFKKPKDKVEKWIFADIEEKHRPDVVLDVAEMDRIENDSIDVINAVELFEHVSKPGKGLSECFRVLKKNGTMILAVPFLFPVHDDPYDFQRWTKNKWEDELIKTGFKIEKLEVMGRYFSVMMDMKKMLIKQLPFGIYYLFILFHPIMDLFVKLDGTKVVLANQKLASYHQGYFIICRKPNI